MPLVNNNGDLATQFLETTHMQGMSGQVSAINPVIVPTINFGPSCAPITRHVNGSATGAVTIYTVPSDRIFFLTSAYLAWAGDATNDGTGADVEHNGDGGTQRRIIGVSRITLTASSNQISASYPFPIRCPPGTVIRFNNSFTAGTAAYQAGITGYEVPAK